LKHSINGYKVENLGRIATSLKIGVRQGNKKIKVYHVLEDAKC